MRFNSHGCDLPPFQIQKGDIFNAAHERLRPRGRLTVSVGDSLLPGQRNWVISSAREYNVAEGGSRVRGRPCNIAELLLVVAGARSNLAGAKSRGSESGGRKSRMDLSLLILNPILSSGDCLSRSIFSVPLAQFMVVSGEFHIHRI
jgi:hypothetical protein